METPPLFIAEAFSNHGRDLARGMICMGLAP
jgi:hypothetical protein